MYRNIIDVYLLYRQLLTTSLLAQARSEHHCKKRINNSENDVWLSSAAVSQSASSK